MYHFSITEPFNLNWKYVAPKDFDTLEVFLRPGLSVELSNIVNGPKQFSIGAYMTGGNERNKFNNEILPARSQERVKQAFEQEEVSCFFSAKDAEDLSKLFDSEKFLCRKVTIRSDHGSDLFGLPAKDFELVMDFFSETFVQQVADVKESRELFEGIRADAVKEVREEHRREERARISGRSKKDERKVKLAGAGGAALLTVAGICKVGSRRLSARGFWGILGALALNLVAAFTSMTGLRLLGGAAEIYAEGML